MEGQSHNEAPRPKRPHRGRLSQFVEGWKGIMNDPYILSIIAKGYRLMSPPFLRKTPWEIFLGAPGCTGNARVNIPDASEERDNRGASRLSRILFKRFPGKQCVRRVASSNRLEAHIFASHFRMYTIS